jgi:hypothetical protein
VFTHPYGTFHIPSVLALDIAELMTVKLKEK